MRQASKRFPTSIPHTSLQLHLHLEFGFSSMSCSPSLFFCNCFQINGINLRSKLWVLLSFFACILQSLWIIAWCFEKLFIQSMIMVSLFLILAKINSGLHGASKLFRFPFSVWFGWITVATFISFVTACQYGLELPMNTPVCTIIFLESAAILAVFWLVVTREVILQCNHVGNLWNLRSKQQRSHLPYCSHHNCCPRSPHHHNSPAQPAERVERKIDRR